MVCLGFCCDPVSNKYGMQKIFSNSQNIICVYLFSFVWIGLILKLRRWKKNSDQDVLIAYLKSWSGLLILVAVISGGGFSTIGLVNSKFLYHSLFQMGLTYREMFDLRKTQIASNVFVEVSIYICVARDIFCFFHSVRIFHNSQFS